MDDKTRGIADGRNRAAGASAELDPETDRRTREIQADIQHTRDEMAETVEALQEKLRPSNVLADATDRVKTATTEKVRSMAETASDSVQGMMRETRDRASDIVEGARQNPLPALMIGAGVAWLLMDKSKKKSDTWSQAYAPDAREPLYSDAEYRTSSRTSGENSLQRVLRDNPLLVGAAAIVAGAAVGSALPETERENELMGETRDSVVNRAQNVARTAASTVQEVAKDAVGEVADRVGSTAPRARIE